MINYDKAKVREALTVEDIFQLLIEWGGEPVYSPFGIISATICHNPRGEGSHKLYFYTNTGLFKCFTGCNDIFDPFELLIKVAKIQWNEDYDLNDAVRWIANHFNIDGEYEEDANPEFQEEWKHLQNYERIQNITFDKTEKVVLKEYDDIILSRFNYTVRILPWLQDGISSEVMKFAKIGYYPGEQQITIPHYDENGRFIGLRGRTLINENAERYGKYRPIQIFNTQYTHPLGMNLYGLNWAKDNIRILKKAIVFESEKSVLQYMTYFGVDNSIAVACCGSNLSSYQMQLLLNLGVTEVVIALDKQFKEINDNECKQWQNKLLKIKDKYQYSTQISFIWDNQNLLDYKDSPTDRGVNIFLQLFNNRIMA